MTNQLELIRQESEPRANIWAFILLAVALIAVSFAAIFIRLSETELGPNATVFNRLIIATLIFGLWNGLGELRLQLSPAKPLQRPRYTKLDLILLLAVGVVSSTSLALWAWSLTQTNIANSTVIRNLTPLFTGLGGWLLLGRSFDQKFLLGLVIALAGAIALGLDDLQIATDNLVGDAAALLSAMFYGGNLLLVEQLRSKFPATTILLWRCFLGSLLTLPLVLTTEAQIFPHTWSGWLWVIALALICQALGQGLVVHSLNRLSSGFVALCLLLEPLITACLAWIIFSEKLSISDGLAFSVIFVGLYLAKSSQSTFKARQEKR
ncbi:MAG: DMT family transporter [Coleofasciculaceae cyanobacterium]